MQEIDEITKIKFGILSKEEILKISVAKIFKNKLKNTNEINSFGTVYDIHMGPIQPGKECITCELKTKDCVGHFGHINLNIDIIHPLYYRVVLSFLKCFCMQCSKILVTKDHIELWDINSFQGEERFEIILKKLIKIRYCTHCNLQQPKYTLSTTDNIFIAQHKVGNVIEKITITINEIKRIFDSISNDDIKLLGLNPSRTHPKNLILSVLPVLPPRSRPFIMTDDGIICDDDLTLSYIEIIKANNNLSNLKLSENKRQKNIQTLKFRIKTLFDNSNGSAKHTNSRQIKGIKERITGKDGLIRLNLMGKRVDFSARTVIGPDPTLRLNEIAIPQEIAKTLSYPENVNMYNIEKLQTLVWNNKVNVIDKFLNGKRKRIHTKYALKNNLKICTLQIGDIVHRQLKNGDIVLLNRQPTLHKGSMLAKRIIIRPNKTIRLCLATTSTFNADFDGDEMNIHTASSELSRAELELLSSTEHNIIGSQASKPVICIVQDALLGCYLMTNNRDLIPKEDFFNFCMKCENNVGVPGETPRGFNFDYITSKFDIAEKIYKKYDKNIPLYSGKTLFSLLLPMDLNYVVKNNAMEDEPILKIEKGILYEGAINKVNLKTSHKSLITLMQKEYANEVVFNFINNVQFLANEYMFYHSFSIGIGDCILEQESKNDEIKDIITKCFIEAEGLEEITLNSQIKEVKINMALGKAKDIGMRIAKESLKPSNNFISTVTSGSKGDYFNIAQIMGLLGQQNIIGSRVQRHLNRGKRTLPHYPFEFNKDDKENEYKSRGFVVNSFIKGLTPQEYWFHAMSGREGIIDTALNTAKSGYIQRKMIKIMEDVQIKYDQTVRNSVNSIIQFSYGSDNLCGTKTVLIDSKPQICNVQRLAEQLNTQFELEHSIIN